MTVQLQYTMAENELSSFYINAFESQRIAHIQTDRQDRQTDRHTDRRHGKHHHAASR